MALVPQILLGALVLLAFAFTAQQRLAIANHAGPAPERQVAFLMRAYHRSSVAAKTAAPSLTGVLADPSPSMTGAAPVAFFFTSCADAHDVVTTLGGASATPGADAAGAYQNQSVARELARQSASPPELGLTAPQRTAVPGIGLSTGAAVETAAGALAFPAGCAVKAGLPAIQTRVVP